MNEASTDFSLKMSIKDLNFYYGELLALKSITLPFFANKVTALIGPSGCGKSTLLRVLNRMYDLYPRQRAEGQVLLDGVNILKPEQDLNMLRARVGMVFQKPTPFPMTIYDNIAFGIKLFEKVPKKELDDRIETALKGAALWDEVSKKLHTSGLSLSGGQQQRLCIARTIAIQPEVILFDEPCSALDPISTAKIEELIDELKEQYTIVIVTHNMQQAARVSEYTAFMYLGELIEYGNTSADFHPAGKAADPKLHHRPVRLTAPSRINKCPTTPSEPMTRNSKFSVARSLKWAVSRRKCCLTPWTRSPISISTLPSGRSPAIRASIFCNATSKNRPS